MMKPLKNQRHMAFTKMKTNARVEGYELFPKKCRKMNKLNFLLQNTTFSLHQDTIL